MKDGQRWTMTFPDSWLYDAITKKAAGLPDREKVWYGDHFIDKTHAIAGQLFADEEVRAAIGAGLDRASARVVAEWRESYEKRAAELEREARELRALLP